jgi:serine/threonine-protein kinase RsbW
MLGEDSVQIDLPATTKYLHLLGPCVSQMLVRVDGLSDIAALAYNIQLAVHEACTNIVLHAYRGTSAQRIQVTFSLETAPKQLVMELRDTGASFAIDEVPDPDLALGQVHGYGLFLMRSLLDEISYHPLAGTNHWRLVKRLE